MINWTHKYTMEKQNLVEIGQSFSIKPTLFGHPILAALSQC